MLPPMPPMGGGSGPMPTEGPGVGQIGQSAVQLAFESSQALKLLAKAVPTLAVTIAEFLSTLNLELGAALNAGQGGVSPLTSPDAAAFPDGSARQTAF